MLREAGKIPVYVARSRPVRPRPELDASEPNKAWRYDGTAFPTKAGAYHLIPILISNRRRQRPRGWTRFDRWHSAVFFWLGTALGVYLVVRVAT
ncbi:MAG: hypothetical protein ACRDJM_10785 [Actinomycetota bacterium]